MENLSFWIWSSLAVIVMYPLVKRLPIPDVLVFIIIGLIGHALHWPTVALATVHTRNIMMQLVAVLLFLGGRQVPLSTLRQVLASVIFLATIGVVLTAAVVAVLVNLANHVPWRTAWLAGAILGNTDPAVVIPLMASIKLKNRVRVTVEAEAALNDVVTSIMVVALISRTSGSGLGLFVVFIQLVGWGLLSGLTVGWLGRWRYAKIGIVQSVLSYTSATMLGGSGFLAAYMAGLINQSATDRVTQLISELARGLLFIILGTQIRWQLVVANGIWPFVVALSILLIVRPVIIILLKGDVRTQWSWRELMMLSWIRESGVVTAALAIMVASYHIPGYAVLEPLALTAILLSIGLQVPTTRWVASRLHLLNGDMEVSGVRD